MVRLGHPKPPESEESSLTLLEELEGLIPGLARSGSTEAVFGRPIEAGGVILIPVARLSLGVLGLDAAARSGLGGGLSLEPVAVVTIRDGNVGVKRLDAPRLTSEDRAGSGLDTLVETIRPLVRAAVARAAVARANPHPTVTGRPAAGPSVPDPGLRS